MKGIIEFLFLIFYYTESQRITEFHREKELYFSSLRGSLCLLCAPQCKMFF